MSEPLAERLSRFTPDGTGLDRDALLFAAGRASVRPRRGWATLAAALALSQAVTLALLWPGTTSPPGPLVTAPPAPQTGRQPDLAPTAGVEPWANNRRILQAGEGDLPPTAPVDSIVPSDPPLHAYAGLSPGELY